MKAFKAITALFLCLAFAQAVPAAGEFKGSWTLQPSETAGQVQFGLFHHMHNRNSQHQSDWPVSAFTGLDLATRARHDVQFTVTRDAGRFECEGFLKDGEGAGNFRFLHSPDFMPAMSKLGFDGIDEEMQFAMAVHDVTLEYARQMKAEKLVGLDTDRLIAFRVHGVSSQYIKELRAEGIAATDADKIVAFRVHGLTAEFVRVVRASGLNPDEDQLIAMRVHGVTPEWIALMKKNGYELRDIDDMIAFRVHGVSPEFIANIEKLGYQHPDPQELVAMRIHGVTPEYITSLRSRGMKDLTIDKMIQLRVHDID